jgi:sporulation protein YlmC with PRC-barrel domain
MLWSIHKLSHYTILAKEGDIGTIHEFLFDDETWKIRYLVADMNNGLSGRKVLIPVNALERPNQVSRKFPIQLTKEQVNNSPSIDTDKLMSPQSQSRLNEYYSLFQYWAMSGYASASLPVSFISDQQSQPEENEILFRKVEDVVHCHVQAMDGELGTVEDIVLDDETWSIRYMIVDARKRLLGKKVWLPPSWAKKINWKENTVFLDRSRETIKNNPEYRPSEAE